MNTRGFITFRLITALRALGSATQSRQDRKPGGGIIRGSPGTLHERDLAAPWLWCGAAREVNSAAPQRSPARDIEHDEAGGHNPFGSAMKAGEPTGPSRKESLSHV